MARNRARTLSDPSIIERDLHCAGGDPGNGSSHFMSTVL